MYVQTRVMSRLFIARLFISLFFLLLVLFPLALFAANEPLPPIDSSPIQGHYCSVMGGASLHEDPAIGTFTLDIPGTPVKAYWYWSGRSQPDPYMGDDTIEINFNGGAQKTLTASESHSARGLTGDWEHFTYLYQDEAMRYIQSGRNSYTVSGLNVNGENHGAGLLVIYEAAHCSLNQVSVHYGLDTFHWSRGYRDGPDFGPDSDVHCSTFAPSTSERTFSFGLIVGGVAHQERGNSLWYATGKGDPPYSAANPLTPDENNLSRPDVTELSDPLNNNPGVEWDMYSNGITIPAGDTYACMQIESPEDDDGISVVWSGLVTSIPISQAAIDIQKSPDEQTVERGDTATFTIRVENRGNVPLTDVIVSDPQAPNCNANLGTMQPGDVKSYDCTLENVNANFLNIASVVGTPPSGDPVEDADDANVTVVEPTNPAINIQKTPDTQTVQSGDSVTFSIRVENRGDVALTNVIVSDPLAPDCDADLGTLQPGEIAIYDCVLANVSADFTNIASVIGTPPSGPLVEDSDDADVTVVAPLNPGIDIQKTPDTQMVFLGFDVTFTIRVENTGDVALSDVTVSDPLAPDCDAELGTLQPGDVVSYECLKTNVSAGFTNVASVVGTPPSGPSVTDSDDAMVTIEQPIITNPSIDIQKIAQTPIIPTGSTATFSIRVENTGDVALTNVIVDDPLTPDCNGSLGTMQPGAVQVYECTLDNVTADFINVIMVTGTPPSGSVVTDSDDASIQVEANTNPSIQIEKTAETPIIVSGSTVTFTIRVENDGDVLLNDVTVSDPLVPACNAQLGTLLPGDVQTYQCSVSNVRDGFTNVASVTGTPQTGDPVSATDDATVRVGLAQIEITKSPDAQIVPTGETATFTIEVENTGAVPLQNVMVTDAIAPDCDRSFGEMLPGATQTYTCTLENVTNPFVNIATVVGTPPDGPPVQDSDDAVVTLDSGNTLLQVSKTDDDLVSQPGGSIDYTISYTNAGDVDAINVVIAEIVPQHTQFDPAASTPGWTCENGNVSAGSRCSFLIGVLPANTSQTDLIFAVVIDDPLPPEVTSIVNQVVINGLNNRAGGQSNVAIEVTPLVPLALDQYPEPGFDASHFIYVPLINQ